MRSETIDFAVQFRDTRLDLSLRVITVLEDSEYQQRFAQIADKKGADKADAECSIYADALASWAAEMPTITNGDGKAKPLGKGTPAEAIQAYFADKNAGKEWMAVTAISAYRNELFPSVTFKKASA